MLPALHLPSEAVRAQGYMGSVPGPRLSAASDNRGWMLPVPGLGSGVLGLTGWRNGISARISHGHYAPHAWFRTVAAPRKSVLQPD